MKVFLLLFFAGLNTFAWFNQIHSLDDCVVMWLPFVSIVASLLFVFPSLKSRTVEIKLLYFFLAGAIYFNSTWYFISLFDSDQLSYILGDFKISSSTFVKSNLLVGISLPLIVTGYLVNNMNYYKSTIPIKDFSVKKIKTAPFILLALLFLFLSISITGLSIGSTYVGTSSYNYILLYRLIILSIVVFSINNFGISKNDKVGLICFLSNNQRLLLILLGFWLYIAIGGDRGPILSTVLILLFGYLALNHMRVSHSQFILFLIGIIVVSALFTFIEILRSGGSDKILSLETIGDTYRSIDSYEQNSYSSQRCTALAIEGIEKGLYSHTYGLFFVQSVIRGIPYLGNIINDAIMPVMPNGSADLLTIQNSGFNYTSGIGTTYIADLYIEFGLGGIIVVSFLYGMMISYFDYKSHQQSFKNISQYLLVAIFSGFSIYTGRGTLVGFFVYFIHTWIIYIIVKSVLNIFGISLYKKICYEK